LSDVEFCIYEGPPHNISNAVPDRRSANLRDFLKHRFGK
jgi:hypothetical protein